MKILKHGDSEIIRKQNNIVQFHCQTCHCIFEADHVEYTRNFHCDLNNVVESGFYVTACPDCHRHVIESMSDEEVRAYERKRTQGNS